MIAVVQRVIEASVHVGDELVGGIGAGLLALLAVNRSDGPADVAWMANKLTRLRAFDYGEKGFHLRWSPVHFPHNDVDRPEDGGNVGQEHVLADFAHHRQVHE